MRPLAAALLVVAAVAHAQAPVPRGEPPTVGVAVPAGAVAGGEDATAVELDPANLAFLPAWNAVFLHTELDADGVRGGRGDALYFGAPLPFVPSLGLGAAVQSIRPPDLFPYRNEWKLSLAVGWRPVPQLALGATYAYVNTGDTGGGSVSTLDLAATARVASWFSIAVVVHDLPGPQFGGLSLQRVYEPELAFRLLGDERIEIALAARIGERRGDVDPRVRLQVVPTAGLRLRGALELRRDVDLDGIAENDLRATVGLEVDLERLGFGGYALFGGNPIGPAGYHLPPDPRQRFGSHWHGFSVLARASGDRYPAIWAPKRLLRVDLNGGTDRTVAAAIAELRRMERDPRADGVVLVVGDLNGSWATMEELRDELLRLRAAGKHVYAYGAEVSTKTYYLASAAEKLWLDPSGGIRLVGMAQTALYFRGSFDLLGVKADFVKIAEYKSAPEQYTRTGPSDEARAMRTAILDDVWGRLVAKLAEARHLDTVKIKQLIDAGPYTAAEAKAAGLVDDLKHGDEIEDAIAALLGHPVEAVPFDPAPRRPRSWLPPAVAVLFVDGDIVEGKSLTIPFVDIKLAGHQTLIEALAQARADARVRAIVLRVDSPGGNALASDLIAREIARTTRVKPVVCSFGDVAASGGYFIAAPCDAIWAAPSTLTGSIGIFTGKFDVSGLAGKLGVSVDVAKRGQHADMEGYFRPYTDEERKLILEKLRYYYDRFLEAVAAGRHLRKDQVDAIGRGHVWTGAQAQKIKLVDHLGGLMDAVTDAKKRAGLGEWERVELKAYPEEPASLLGQLARLLGVTGQAEADLPSLRAAARGLPGSLLAQPSTPQARMEFTLVDER